MDGIRNAQFEVPLFTMQVVLTNTNIPVEHPRSCYVIKHPVSN